MIFNRENLKKFISHISLENYLNLKNADAFEWLHSLQSVLNYQIEQTPVEDVIYYYEGKDFFNLSPSEKFKFFIEKDDETMGSIKLFFYNFNDKKTVKIKVGDNESIIEVQDKKLFDLGFNKSNYQKVIIEIDSEVYDITDIIKSERHNTIR
jgi:hypothetical protein